MMKMLRPVITAVFLYLIAGCTAADDESKLIWVKSNCDSVPIIDFQAEEILEELEVRYQDSVLSTFWSTEYKKQLAVLNKFKKDSFGLFPYQQVDSALFYFFEPIQKEDGAIPLSKREMKDVSVLCLEKVDALLNVINNPMNFGFGECGTNIPHSKVELFNRGEIIGEIVFGCNYSMISTNPKSPMVTGGLTERGDSLLTLIKLWD